MERNTVPLNTEPKWQNQIMMHNNHDSVHMVALTSMTILFGNGEE